MTDPSSPTDEQAVFVMAPVVSDSFSFSTLDSMLSTTDILLVLFGVFSLSGVSILFLLLILISACLVPGN